MNLEIPLYNFSHTRPIIGFGNFSYIEPSGSPMVDRTIVQSKFDLWRYVLKNRLLQSSDEYTRIKAWSLLTDKTILAYYKFKFDNKPLKLRWYQDVLLSDHGKRVLFTAANQVGKSLTLNIDAAIEFLTDHGKNWVGVLVSNSLDQSMFQMDRIKMLLRSAEIDYREEETTDKKTGKKDNATQVSYTFYDNGKPKYTNLLICCPHTSSALGYPANVLWLDEFDFWENVKNGQEHFLYQIAIPRTFETKGSIKIFSNPNGKERLLYKLWNQKDEQGNPVWHRYQFNYWDKPTANQAEFNTLKRGMTAAQVESTLLAVFSRSEGAFFSSEEIRDSISPELNEKRDQAGIGRETAWFLDVGSVHDQSVLVGGYLTENEKEPSIPILNVFWVHKYPVGYPLSRVVGIDLPDDGWESETDNNPSVKEVLGMYSEEVNGIQSYPLFGCDVTGNAGIIPLFNTAGIEPVDITFSGKRKWHMYQRFQYYMQQRYLKRALDRDENTVAGKDTDYQLSKLIVKKSTNTVYRQIHHENEDDFDDVPDSIAGLIYIIDCPDLPGLSFDIINNGKSMLPEIEQEKEEIKEYKKNNPQYADQYIPGFYNMSDFDKWMSNKEKVRQ